MKWRNFFICGLAGWCMEIVFTSFGTFLHGDPRLLGQTSLWMFPIYGMAALIDPIYEKIKYWPFLLRGCFYATSIMLGEFLSGSLLRFLGVCPWDYSGTPYNIAGIVRLDYFPFWVVAGLAFEVLLRFLDERIFVRRCFLPPSRLIFSHPALFFRTVLDKIIEFAKVLYVSHFVSGHRFDSSSPVV